MKKNERGFTLVELMVAVVLSTMVGSVLFLSTRAGNEQADTSETRMAIQDAAREGLYKMLQEIRSSAPSRVTIPTGGAYIQFVIPDPSSLVTASYDANWASAHTIKYSVGGTGGTQLIRQDLTTNTSTVVANNITSLTFSGNSAQPTLVTATISTQRTTSNGRLIPATPLQLTAQAVIRNP